MLLTKRNIGCVAAAISLGLVDQNQKTPINESTVYTDIMKSQAGKDGGFMPPSPGDFTSGEVYACAAAGKPDFALFGAQDSGRFKDVATAASAVEEIDKLDSVCAKSIRMRVLA